MTQARTAIIIGAGPAGLTAAYELLTRTDIRPIVLEKTNSIGGISQTVNYKGNRMDIGGHRFFSKSDRVMQWWLDQMPIHADGQRPTWTNAYEQKAHSAAAGAHHIWQNRADVAQRGVATNDHVMLVRGRKSRIYFLRKFFDYPIQLTPATLRNLGVMRSVRIGFSYVRAALFPIRPARNLEQFFINRFGRELYNTFFKSYTEKVWGVRCQEISAEWGQQRIKGLSIRKTIAHFLKKMLGRKKRGDVAQKDTETSLIEQFLYPKFGPGQMWELIAEKVKAKGGQVITGFGVTGISVQGGRVAAVSGTGPDGTTRRFEGDFFFSTMPIQDLVRALDVCVPEPVRRISDGLMYRDFITVGLLLNKLKVQERNGKFGTLISDNWIYIQEPDVEVGRLQIFNNWSPYLVANPEQVWMGAEYFCVEGDELWRKSDRDMAQFAVEELDKIGIIDRAEVKDFTVIRMPKTYPAYFGTYDEFPVVREYLDGFENLFLIGRNGMHKYNNQDHSMLTAMAAVDNVLAGCTDKSNIWAVNTESEYHESK